MSCTATETWCGDGNVNGSEACDDGADGDATDGCNDSCEITVNGACGSLLLSTQYDFNNSGDAITGGNSNLCASGVLANFNYAVTGHVWTWDCEGNGGVLGQS